MKAYKLREMTDPELQEQLRKLKEEHFNLRVQQALHQLENPMRLGALRKDIARVHTILRERALGIRKESQES